MTRTKLDLPLVLIKLPQVTKGNTISQFLEAVRQQWHELRGVHVDNLMYIKEDLIIPHVR